MAEPFFEETGSGMKVTVDGNRLQIIRSKLFVLLSTLAVITALFVFGVLFVWLGGMATPVPHSLPLADGSLSQRACWPSSLLGDICLRCDIRQESYCYRQIVMA